MKLTLKYSSFLFVNGASLVKNIPQEVHADKLTNKDKIILNAYIRSGAVVSDGGEFVIDVEEVVEVTPTPVVEEVAPEVKEETPSIEVILDEPKEEVEVEAEPAAKKKAPVKKATTKK